MRSQPIAVVALALLGTATKAQNAEQVAPMKSELVLRKLAPPLYPPLAKQAQISGDVELILEIRQDGSVANSAVVKGHPLLAQAAVDSAKKSQFECRNCPIEGQSVRFEYTFALGPTSYCAQNISDQAKVDADRQQYPQVKQEAEHVTIVDQPIGTCDPAGEIKHRHVRSLMMPLSLEMRASACSNY